MSSPRSWLPIRRIVPPLHVIPAQAESTPPTRHSGESRNPLPPHVMPVQAGIQYGCGGQRVIRRDARLSPGFRLGVRNDGAALPDGAAVSSPRSCCHHMGHTKPLRRTSFQRNLEFPLPHVIPVQAGIQYGCGGQRIIRRDARLSPGFRLGGRNDGAASIGGAAGFSPRSRLYGET